MSTDEGLSLHLADVAQHRLWVAHALLTVITILTERAVTHDLSKYEDAERAIYAATLPALQRAVYGTPDYREAVATLGPALTHHYAVNRHHPEHHAHGVDDMTLIDVIEMVCDWVAAAKRTNETVASRLDALADRFAVTPQMQHLIANTLVLLEGAPQ